MTVDSQPGRIAARRVIVWVGLFVGISLFVMTLGAVQSFESALQPELNKRSHLIGETVRESVERALELGVPFDSIAGVDAFLEKTIADFAEVRRISLVGAGGSVIASAERADRERPTTFVQIANVRSETQSTFGLPVLARNILVGEIRIEIDSTFVRTRLRDVALDVLVVGLVSVLLAFELVVWSVAGALGKPVDRLIRLLRLQSAGDFGSIVTPSDAGNLKRIARRVSDRASDLASRASTGVQPKRLSQAYFVDVRLPLFVFSTATEISGAFMPIYARDASGPEWMSYDFAATAPLLAYLGAIAVVAPFGSRITRAFSPRTIFLVCVPFTALAMVGVGFAHSTLGIALWHGAMALVYAAATIACQEYAIRTAPKGENAQAIGSYLFVILGGAFSGTALGGVLADRIGEGATFFFGGFLVILSGALATMTMTANLPDYDDTAVATQATSRRHQNGIYFNPRYLAVVLGVAVPMNIGMSVFIWYLTPLILEATGATFADIGRVVMVYYLVSVLTGPVIARLADGRIGYPPMLIIGLLLSGAALSTLAIWSGFWPLLVVVAIFGFGYAMCDATLYAQIINIAGASGRPEDRHGGLATVRLIERLAAIFGLVTSAILADALGYISLAAAIGAMMLLGGLILLLTEGSQALLSGRERRRSL